MTDLEKTKVFLNDLKITYKEIPPRPHNYNYILSIEEEFNEDKFNGTAVEINFSFDDEGKFIDIGAWE